MNAGLDLPDLRHADEVCSYGDAGAVVARLRPAAVLELRKPRTLLKKGFEGLVEVAQGLLQRHGVVELEPLVLLRFLGSGKKRLQVVDDVERFSANAVEMVLDEERHVPAFAHSTPLSPKERLLFGRGIDAEFRCFEHWRSIERIVNYYHYNAKIFNRRSK